MDEIKKIGKNSISIYLARISDFILGIVTMSIIAKYLSVDPFGQYIFILTVGWILYTVLSMGVEPILLREISRNRSNAFELLVTALLINGMVFGLSAALYGAAVPFLRFDKIVAVAMFLNLISELLKVLMRTHIAVFLAFEKMAYDTLLTFAGRVFILMFTLFVVTLDLGFIYLFYALIAGNGIALLISIMLAKKELKFNRLGLQLQQGTYLLKESFPVVLKSISQQLYFYIGVFIVRLLTDDTGVALFQGPNKILTLLQMVPVAFLTAFAPMLARLAVSADTHDQFNTIYDKAFKFLIIISLPISVGGTLLAPKIITLIFGTGFDGAILTLKILIWAANFLFLDTLFTFILVSSDKQKYLIGSNILCVVVNLFLSYVLVLNYGYIGAAWAALFSYFILFSANYYFVTKELKHTPSFQGVVQIIVGSFVMGVFLSQLINLNLFILMIAGFIVYSLTILVLNVFSLEEKILLKKAVTRS